MLCWCWPHAAHLHLAQILRAQATRSQVSLRTVVAESSEFQTRSTWQTVESYVAVLALASCGICICVRGTLVLPLNIFCSRSRGVEQFLAPLEPLTESFTVDFCRTAKGRAAYHTLKPETPLEPLENPCVHVSCGTAPIVVSVSGDTSLFDLDVLELAGSAAVSFVSGDVAHCVGRHGHTADGNAKSSASFSTVRQHFILPSSPSATAALVCGRSGNFLFQTRVLLT